jgi:hypothetical protein
MSGLILETRSYSMEVWAEAMARSSRILDGRSGEPISQIEAETFAWRELVGASL